MAGVLAMAAGGAGADDAAVYGGADAADVLAKSSELESIAIEHLDTARAIDVAAAAVSVIGVAAAAAAEDVAAGIAVAVAVAVAGGGGGGGMAVEITVVVIQSQ